MKLLINFSLKQKQMKRVTILTLLLMAFVSFATMESFADNSPPGVEISIDYELHENPDFIETNFTGVAGVQTEGEITVHGCDLKIWPNEMETLKVNNKTPINFDNINALVNDLKSIQFNYVIENKSCQLSINSASYLFGCAVNENEVLSLFYNSNGERHAVRNAVI